MKTLTKSLIIILFLLVTGTLGLWGAVSFADIPKSINFQGRLTDRDGKPLEGSQPIGIFLYDAPTAGNRLWSETQTVSIFNGVFDCVLGSAAPFPSNLDFNKQYYLEFSVGGQTLLPRQKLSSTPYSLNSERLAGLTANDFLRPDTKGNVGIGTTAPERILDIAPISGIVRIGTWADISGDNGGNAVFGSNMYRLGDNKYYYTNTHGSLGYAGLFAGWGGISFMNAAGATTKDASFTPVVSMRINTDGKVGIGTTVPNQKLSVTDTLAITNTSGIQYLLMGNQDSAGANNPAIIRAANGRIDFGGGTSWSGSGGTYTSNMVLTDNGYLGIGTVSPQQLLSVNGNITIPPGAFYRWEDANGTYRGAIRANDTSYDLEFYTQAAGGGPRVVIQNDGDLIVNNGKVKAKEFITGDITFTNKQTGTPLWTMFEDENGLYLKSATTGKEYKFILEEMKR